MEPRIFYRIERHDDGPYCLLDESWMKSYHGDENHPGPRDDFSIEGRLLFIEILEKFQFLEKAVYCFSSKEQLLDWFMFEELIELFKRNFKIIKIISNNYIIAQKQAVVHYDHKEIIDDISSYKEMNERFLNF